MIYMLFSNNNFTGTIFESIGSLSKSKNIDFTVNHLSGTNPPEFFEVKYIGSIMLGSNNLTGIVSIILAGNESHLGFLNIMGNILTGLVSPKFG